MKKQTKLNYFHNKKIVTCIQITAYTLIMTTFIFYSACKKDTKGDYDLTGQWVCDHNLEYEGELIFTSETFQLSITYLFQDTISGTIKESGSYSYTSSYHASDNLFSNGYYSGSITFNSSNKTYSIAYSYGEDESFAFVNYKIDPKITLGTMWWEKK